MGTLVHECISNKNIKSINSNDIDTIVKLHLDNLKEGLMPILGKGVLTLFYLELFKDKDSFILAYYQNNEIIGCVAASKDLKKLINNLKRKHFIQITLSIIKKITIQSVISVPNNLYTVSGI